MNRVGFTGAVRQFDKGEDEAGALPALLSHLPQRGMHRVHRRGCRSEGFIGCIGGADGAAGIHRIHRKGCRSEGFIGFIGFIGRAAAARDS